METTYAQQAAAAARNGDHDNASALYNRAAIEAEKRGEYAKAKGHWSKADHQQRMAENA